MDAVERMRKAIEDDHCGSDEWTISVTRADLAGVLQENDRMRAKIAELQEARSALVGERQEIRAVLSDLYGSCERDFLALAQNSILRRNCYGNDRDIEIFQHGMKTVCNVVDAAVAKILGRGK